MEINVTILFFLFFFDRYACANNLDQMPQITLFHQGLRCFPLIQQCLEKSVDTSMPLLRNQDKYGKNSQVIF